MLTTWIRGALCVAVAAWAANLPLVLIHFERVSLWGWLNTLLVLPLVFAVMVTSFAKILCGLVLPGLAGLLTPAGECLAELLAAWVSVLSRLPGVSMYAPPPPGWLAVLYYVALAAWIGVHLRARSLRGVGAMVVAAALEPTRGFDSTGGFAARADHDRAVGGPRHVRGAGAARRPDAAL